MRYACSRMRTCMGGKTASMHTNFRHSGRNGCRSYDVVCWLAHVHLHGRELSKHAYQHIQLQCVQA
jgi:hypothetical protein